jgi:hypothetical protein
MLGRCHAVATTAGVETVLLKPISNRLASNAELAGQIIDASAYADEIKDLTPKLGRVCPGMLFACHWWTLLRQAESIHGTGPASVFREVDFLLAFTDKKNTLDRGTRVVKFPDDFNVRFLHAEALAWSALERSKKIDIVSSMGAAGPIRLR